MISILGTGWLGLPLAKTLLNEGYIINGSATSESRINELEMAGIVPFVVRLEEIAVTGSITEFLSQSRTLIINFPPGLRRNPNSSFIKKMETLLPSVENSSIQNVLYISSTSVFEDQVEFPIITDNTIPDATSNAGKQLIRVEELLRMNTNFNTTILRFGGLFGRDRHPSHMLSKRSNIKNPDAPVNLIHLDDCISIILKIIATNSWNTTYNAAYPQHPTKKSYYSENCAKLGLSLPDYDLQTPSKGKIISPEKVIKDFNYQFKRNLYFKE